jgi:D-alanyl-D-alanine carboxypeptidase
VRTLARPVDSIGKSFLAVATVLAAIVFLLAAAPAEAKYAAIVMDADSGAVLYEANADTHNYPASLTKMMTLYLTFEALESGKLKLDQHFTVSHHASIQAPSKLGLQPGETIAVRDAILALVTKSANDVAVTVAENLAGSEPAFAERMTRKAQALGMKDTIFHNASGLPNPDQHTTARDLARLALALYRDFPNEYRYFGTQEFTYHGMTHVNHNHLMAAFEGMDGIKTGFINASGFNLAASAVRNNRRLIGVVMGGQSARSRDQQMAALLNDAFANRLGRPTMVAAKSDDVATESAEAIQPPSRAARMLRSLSPVASAEAAPVKVAAARRPVEKGVSGWSVQIGAFAKQNAAEKAAASAAGKITGGKRKPVQIVGPARGDKEHVWRARLANFSKKEARDACRVLHKKHVQCAVVAPSV